MEQQQWDDVSQEVVRRGLAFVQNIGGLIELAMRIPEQMEEQSEEGDIFQILTGLLPQLRDRMTTTTPNPFRAEIWDEIASTQEGIDISIPRGTYSQAQALRLAARLVQEASPMAGSVLDLREFYTYLTDEG